MATYVLRRLLLMGPTLLGVTFVVFSVMALSPGGFSGVVLSQQGGLTEGEEAKRIREYFMRRYGLDKPYLVQYGRWLNQVSPIGFLTSSQLQDTLTDANVQIRAVLEDANFPWPTGLLDDAVDLTLALAAYRDIDPETAANELLEAVQKPVDSGFIFQSLNVDTTAWAGEISVVAQRDIQRARHLLIDRLSSELAGRDRMLLSRFTVKWPDLGQSLRGRRVIDLLSEALPVTLLLNVISIPLIYGIAIITGIYAARHRGRFFDLASGGIFLTLWSIPAIWAGLMLIGYLANEQYLKLFPTGGMHDLQADAMAFLPRWSQGSFDRGWLLDACWHLALPIFCLTYGGLAVLSKLTRGAILENLSADFVRTARAKGVGERDILFRHVLRNSILPLITVAASILPAMLAGSVIVENIFSLPGMGKLSVDAAFMKDREVVMGTTLIGGMIGLLSELIRDLCYAVADPRVSYE